ncbi:MAG: carboxylesterase, partial [Spirochaetia bacterium]|nr:carboxylesterase [Spirochaetia bacterium]
NLHSLVRSLFTIRRSLKHIRIPLHTIYCKNDLTVRIEDQIYVQRKTSSRIKRSDTLFIKENKTTRHLLLTHKETSKKVIKFIDEFISHNK